MRTNNNSIITPRLQLRIHRRRSRRLPILRRQKRNNLRPPINTHSSIPLARIPIQMLDSNSRRRRLGAADTAEFDGSVIGAS